MVLQVTKYFAHLSCPIILQYIWLMLFSHELKQGLLLVKQFSVITRNVSSRYYSHVSTFSHSVVCKRRNL